jgi:hypothetical protein
MEKEATTKSAIIQEVIIHEATGDLEVMLDSEVEITPEKLSDICRELRQILPEGFQWVEIPLMRDIYYISTTLVLMAPITTSITSKPLSTKLQPKGVGELSMESTPCVLKPVDVPDEGESNEEAMKDDNNESNDDDRLTLAIVELMLAMINYNVLKLKQAPNEEEKTINVNNDVTEVACSSDDVLKLSIDGMISESVPESPDINGWTIEGWRFNINYFINLTPSTMINFLIVHQISTDVPQVQWSTLMNVGKGSRATYYVP